MPSPGGKINCALSLLAHARPLDSLARDLAAPVGPALHTTRLLLRPLEPGDAVAFHRLINDWDICRKLPEAPFPYPADLAAGWIAAAGADRAGGVAEQFAVVDTASGALLGWAGLRLSRDRRAPISAIGWAGPSGARGLAWRRRGG